MRRVLLMIGIAWALLALLCPASEAQQMPIKPFFTQTGLDGQLIGLELDTQLGIWKPIAALAYGLESGRFRYKAGLLLVTGLELPLLGQRLGDFSVALVDWPTSAILGREGQMGIELGWSLGRAHFSLFTGNLWTKGGEAPHVNYLLIDTSYSFELPFDLRLSTSAQMVFGMLVEGSSSAKPFQSMARTLSLSLGDLRLSGRWGTLANEAQLAGFQFTTGVRGISETLKGHQFWNVTLERTFPMHESSMELPGPPLLTRFLPRALPVRLAGVLFFQAGGAIPEESAQFEMLFSWGMSATFSVHELRLRAELIFAQDGQTRFNFSF